MKILFVEDDLQSLKVHLLELRDLLLEVTPTDTVDRAWDLFNGDSQVWAGVIIDQMMPTGELVPAGTPIEEVGIHLLRRFREIRPDVPAVFLTNMRMHPVLVTARGMERVKVVLKREMPADKFAGVAKEFFESFRRPRVPIKS